ncbi:sensor histidine kinase [Fructobacillus sp. M1-13]|uniref:histidine kinase n=1 Tax=Fructobacillus papyriferae TaxID=2713171 RepID=A0ABS5QNR2_9LACO|nr:sensor histidine kinase [Fructobacillus papyriferae]MBS9334676.1 sensor histidine kinase [Fructobacillus papyriferae]MCD2158666.1 sensor histidine kinase [Fructobacillus papyriferae]
MIDEQTTTLQQQTLRGLRWPFVWWVILGTAMALYEGLHSLAILDIVLVSLIALGQVILIAITFKKIMIRQWSLTIQIVMLLAMMFIIHGLGSGIILLAISPILIIQAIIFEHLRWANISAIILFALFFLSFVVQKNNLGYVLFYIEVAGLMLLIIFLFAKNYQSSLQRQVDLKHANAELAMAYNQVDQLSTAKERERIARELHDTLLQDMTGLAMQLDVLTTQLNRGNIDKAKRISEQASRLSKETLVTSRRVVSEVREGDSVEASLINRLKVLTKTFYKNYGLSVQLQLSCDAYRTGKEVAVLLKIISEAMMNVVKHSQSDFALISIHEEGPDLFIQIIDYGAGFDFRQGLQRKNHFGLAGMQERVSELGGKVTVDSEIGEGTTVTIRLPK